ncbi:hypothetical protein [Polyangium aurulentum]|uniref:hypothetical protein n=1 Tax=Polyangium aurulentum TaxID=2567896 RepID=UPI0010ADDB2A|nr:hypothetical protein [Polyangium aurulentum]UQA55422.1 hypothetical protein E8A73_029235 [Polyangium aurulentum]
MLGRLVTLVVPALAVLVTALVLLGPGSARPALGARVHGLPVAGGTTLALRLTGARRLFGVDDVASLDDVRVEAHDGPTPLSAAHTSLGPDGVGEVVLHADTPLSGPISLRVLRGEHVLVEGAVPLRPAAPLATKTGAVHGVGSGDLAIAVSTTRGQLAAPFPEAVRIEIPGAAGVAIEASAPGAEITPDKVITDARGVASIRVKPVAHHVELELRARALDGRTGRWEGLLPVLPGAVWLDPSRTQGALVLVSPAPRERVYVSIVADEGRLLGAVVPLVQDAEGFFRGQFAFTPARGAQLVVSTDPQERGAGTVAWPLEPPEGAALAPRIEPLLDGMPDAEAREKARAGRARRAAIQVVGASALFEILLLLVRSRRAQQKLEEGLADAAVRGADPGLGLEVPVPEADRRGVLRAARERPTLRVALAVALVLLAFAVVAAVSTFR